ncbi:MAG: Efflux pump periplasmic linker BepF [Lentisphaerae bacterium ADurb.Bin242]|nr:MAG: Efflux pump periplasmic linker BepF [Lentisphaerae bacterium ADurb.Bin242]
MKKSGFILFAVFVALFILWAMLYQAGIIGAGPKVPAGEKNSPGTTEKTDWKTLSAVEIPVYYSAVGTIRSREEIQVVSRLLTARVVDVRFRSGESFKEGEVLIRLENRDLQAKVDAAAENLKGAESRLAFAQSEYDRNSKLVETRAVAQRIYEQSVSSLNAARAEVAMMKHELENARTNLDYATIRAPFSGIVSERKCDPGDLATPLNPLMKIFNPAKLQLHVPIRENLFRQVRIGDRLEAQVESTGKTFSAEIREIIPSVDPGSRTFFVNAYLSENIPGLMPGMFARCEIPIGKKSALVVPEKTLIRIGQLEYLDLRGQDGRTVRQLVKTVPAPGGNRVEIVSGVKTGDQYRENRP